MPTAIYSGSGSLKKIPDILVQNNVRRAAIFTDRGILAAGLLDAPLAQVRQAGVEPAVLSDLPPEPTYSQAQNLVDKCRASDADFIIAVGGGSVMDTAKLASVLLEGVLDVQSLLDNPASARKCVKSLMIPTTAGTGAEATPNAIVAVPEQSLKVGIVNDEMIPDYVILDADLIRRLPRPIAASTGIDALAHALECFTGKKATPFSDLFALKALDLIFHNIEAACNCPEAISAKENMLLASFYAGVAITASGTTAVHALSYPLGGKYHIPHGVSNAILLTPVMRFNQSACQARLAEIYDRCMAYTPISQAEKGAAVLSWLEEIVKRLDIPSNLRGFGVTQEDLEDLVAAGMTVTRLLNNNIRTVTAQDARSIYRQIL